MTQTSISLALAGLTFLLTVIWGAPFLRILKHWRLTEEPVTGGDPGTAQSMGGLLFVLPVVLLTGLLNFTHTVGLTGFGFSILLPTAAMLAFAALGGWLDLRRLRGQRPGGRDYLDLAGKLLLSGGIAYGLKYLLDVPEMYFPFFKGELELGAWFLPAAMLVVLGTVHSFQLTAGIDGLPGMLGATSYAAYGALAILQEQTFLARFCFSVVGALLGFLWFNIKPAELRMSRTGTYAMGASLAVVALMTGQWPLLAAIAIVPLLEASSVLLQQLVRPFSPQRLPFKATPLHAHLQMQGWSTTQIVQRFWLVNLLFAMIGITLALV